MSFDNVVLEAEENLRAIRSYMERSKRYSNFAGFSGICGGLAALGGTFVQRLYVLGLPSAQQPLAFVINWLVVIAVALGCDYAFTRRRAELVDKAVLVRLGSHMARAAWPGLFVGIVFTVSLVAQGQQDAIYPYWMLCYGLAISAVAVSASREVVWLGYTFVVAGAAVLLFQSFGNFHFVHAQGGLLLFGILFGLGHIVYGVLVGRSEGW